MISLDLSITGAQIGAQIADDPEEAFYMFREIADEVASDFAEEVAGYANDHERAKIVSFLRDLAAHLDT